MQHLYWLAGLLALWLAPAAYVLLQLHNEGEER